MLPSGQCTRCASAQTSRLMADENWRPCKPEPFQSYNASAYTCDHTCWYASRASTCKTNDTGVVRMIQISLGLVIRAWDLEIDAVSGNENRCRGRHSPRKHRQKRAEVAMPLAHGPAGPTFAP